MEGLYGQDARYAENSGSSWARLCSAFRATESANASRRTSAFTVASASVAPLAAAIRAARAARGAIRGNLVRSLVYNVTAVGAAALGFVNPLVAAVLMPLSSGLVLWGASRVETRVRRGEFGGGIGSEVATAGPAAGPPVPREAA